MDKEDIDQQEDDQIEDKNDGKALTKGQKKKLKSKSKNTKADDAEPEPEGKKETTPAPKPEETKAQEQAPTDSKAEDDDDEGDDEPGKSGLSKAQKKKLKDKAKKEAAAKAEPETKAEAPKEKEADKGKKDAKKKPLNAAALMAQERLKEKQRLEEEQRKIEEEIRLKEEAEQKARDEEERILKEEEAKRRKIKEDKLKTLKEAGDYKTPKQLAKEAEVARQREEMLKQLASQGINLDELQSDQPRRNNYKKKPKPGQSSQSAETKAEAPQEEAPQEDSQLPAEATVNTTATTIPEPKEEVAAEDWESMLTQEEVKVESQPKQEVKVETKIEEKVEDKKPKKKDIIEPAKEEKKDDKKKKKKGDTVEETVKYEAKPRTKEQYDEETRDVKNQKDFSDNFRSPVCCILGHVDTGKTKLLDKMRNTSVQDGEAGGITQQIGATFFPYEKLREEVLKCADFYKVYIDIPGLLVIDTPGHESFSNLRSRGHGLCDIAILVVDIMHGLQKQTMESIDLLRFRKTPFVIALNKIDRMYGWKAHPNDPSYTSLKKQQSNSSAEFRDRAKQIIADLMSNGLNAALYYDNPDPYTWEPEISEPFISVVPTSAITGEGIPDLLSCVINLSQRIQRDRILRRDDEFKCTVLEVKVIEGLGATIDVMLINGYLREGDKIILAGYEGIISTHIRSLLTPHPMKEMRVKNEYIHHKEIRSAMGIKISAVDLDKALAGSELFVIKEAGDEEKYKEILEAEVSKIKKSINLVDDGCFVVASTLGSLEALLQFLRTSKIPVAGISIGPVSKTEVIKAMKPLQIVEGAILKEYATILAFDVKVLSEAQELATQEGVKIFTADIIYHLFDQFTAYLNDIQEERKRNEGKVAVFPCILKTVAFFNKKDPIIMGVDVVEGVLKLGTPICALDKDRIKIGVIESIEKEHKPIQEARISDGSVAIKFKGDPSVTAGRHFEQKDRLVSILSRESIDALKKYFRDEMSKTDWELIKKLKSSFNIL